MIMSRYRMFKSNKQATEYGTGTKHSCSYLNSEFLVCLQIQFLNAVSRQSEKDKVFALILDDRFVYLKQKQKAHT